MRSIGAVLLLLVSTAEAQEDPYRESITAAVTEFDAGRFAEARALFRRAHELQPNARTLRGIGLASFELSDYPEAYRSLAAALTDQRQPLTPEQSAEVQALLDRTRAFVGLFRIAVTPEDAQIEIDGHTGAIEPDGRVLLQLGAHTVTARAEGFRERVHEVRVEGGEDETIELALEAVTEREEAPPPPPPVAGADPIPGIALLVIGGAASAASIAIGVAWWAYQDEQVGLCDTRPGCENRGDVAGARDASMGTTLGAAGVGAALMAVGAILLATSGGSSESALHCAPGVLGAMCGGAF